MTEASDWRALHPASVLVNLLPMTWRGVRSLWPFLLAVFIGGMGRETIAINVGVIGFFLIAPTLRVIFHWLTLRYRLDGGNLIIQTGLLNKQERTIPPERIQNVELVRNVFHRLSGLVELRIETASGADVEGMLSALSVAEAERLVRALEEARVHRDAPTEEEPPILLMNTPWELAQYGLSSLRFGLAVVGFGVIYEALLADSTRAESAWSTLGTLGALVILFLLTLGAWIAGATTTMLRHWNHTLRLQGDRLVVEEGLFTRRRVELPRKKVQTITSHASVLRRWLGFTSLHIDTAAPRVGGGTEHAEAVLPVVHAGELHPLLLRLAPEAPGPLQDADFTGPHPKALLRALLSSTIVVLTVTAAGLWFFGPWASLLLLGLAWELPTTWLDHRHQGWWLGETHLVSRTGWWNRRVTWMSLEKLQSAEVVQGPLARRWSLAQLRVRVAGSGVVLPLLSWDDALALEARLIARSGSALTPTSHGAPPLDHDEDAAREQHPRDGLGDQAHHQERRDHHPVAITDPEVVAAPEPDGGSPEATSEQSSQEDRDGAGMRRPIEADLPGGTETSLEHHPGPLSDQEGAEGDVHSGHEDSQA